MTPPPGPRERVAACSRYLRRRGGVALALLTVGTAGLALPLAWILVGAGGWRAGSGLPLLILGIAGAAAFGALVWGWRRVHDSLDSGTMITRIEKASGLPAGRLRAQLELESAPPEGTSSSLVGAGQAGITGAMNRPASELSGDGRTETGHLLRVGAVLAGAMALITLSLLAAAPNRAEVAWAGLVRPLATLNPPALPPLEVAPGDARVPRGEEVSVVIGASGRREVSVRYDAPGEPTGTLTLPVIEGRAVGTLPPVTGTTRYQVRGDDGALSPEYLLEPEDPLLFEGFSLLIEYPDYTGLPPETRALPPASLVIPAGTSLRFSGRLAGRSDDMPEALVLVETGETPGAGASVPPLTLALDGRDFDGRWTPRRSTAVTWEARGQVGEGYRLPGNMEVEVVPDAPPEVTLSRMGEGSGSEISAAMRLPLRIEAQDDWGLGWVELEVRVFPEGAPVGETADRTMAEGARRVVLEPVLDLARWGLEPGTRIRIQARAGDRGAGPGIGESEPMEFRIPTPAALRQEAREQIRAAAESAEELAERASREQAQVEARVRDRVASGAAQAGGGASADPSAGGTTPSGEGQASFQDREALRETLEGEARLLRELESIRASLERSADAVGRGSEERELRRTLADLEQRMAALGGDDALARAEARLDALQGETLSAPEAAAAMLEAAERQAALTEQLEALLERLRETALGAEVDAAREEASLVTQAQEALAREVRSPDGDGSAPPSPPTPAEAEAREADRQARQEALRDRTRELETRVEALEARLREQGQDGAGDAASQAAQALEQAAAAMEEAAAPGDPSAVGERADAATEAARAAEAAMQDAAAAAREARSRRVRDVLTAAAVQALVLSEAFSGASPEDSPEGRASDAGAPLAVASAAREGTRNLARALGDGLLDQPDLARELSPRTGAALAALDRVVDAVSAPGAGQTAAPAAGFRPQADRARQALQALSLAALDVLARGAGEEEGGEGGGSSEQMMEALDALADAQNELNRDAEAMGSEPGQARAGAGGQEGMEALASGQQAVASALGELGAQPGGERIAGNLEELRQEAEALARELAGSAEEGRPRAETYARQERLLERLLEAGRTLERDEPTQERRGTAARPVERPLIPALPPGLLDRSGVAVPSAEDLARLSPAERRLVLEYFARLNRGGTP
ncbi:MAG: hypothetical protein EA350_01285 [Gemmatimonadales bacterium]|nr:MAG: hypothetical protein EA350_01285 [Gemmatimonadales bacterium]